MSAKCHQNRFNRFREKMNIFYFYSKDCITSRQKYVFSYWLESQNSFFYYSVKYSFLHKIAIQYDVMSFEHSWYFLRTTVPQKGVINWIQMIDYIIVTKSSLTKICHEVVFLFYYTYGIISSVSIGNSVSKFKNRYNKVLRFF